jgi:hypothetical protein
LHWLSTTPQPKQEQVEPVACDNCKKLEDELEPLRIKAELWKRDAIVWKSAYDVEVGFREQEQGEPYGYLKLNTGKFVNEVEGLNPMKDKRYLPLYTTPQQRKPLTLEQLREHWQVARVLDMTDAEIDFADYVLITRDVEALYGIKE